jgi:hypothetical protein
MTPENLVIMRPSVMIVETTRFHLKACDAIHPTLWLVTDGVLKALILGRPCRTRKIVAVVPRRGNKKSSLSHSPNLMLLKCLRSILLLFRQHRRKSLLPKRKGGRGQTPKRLRKKVLQRE